MEKIQAALQKARNARTEAPRPPNSGPVGHGRKFLKTSDAAWAEIAPFSPDLTALADRRIITPLGGHDAAPFDSLRTKLVQQMRANNWRRLAITSPTAGCGKSTICANLGFSLSRQPDLRTIIAELDLRRPSLSGLLGLTTDHSFARVLEGRSDFAANAVRYGDNLLFSTNQGPSRNSSELLQADMVTSVLADIETIYQPDLFIFDLPPMLVSDDAIGFVGKVDCVLLVAAAEASTIKEIDLCERELASQTNVLGVILNKCQHMGREYGYGYYG